MVAIHAEVFLVLKPPFTDITIQWTFYFSYPESRTHIAHCLAACVRVCCGNKRILTRCTPLRIKVLPLLAFISFPRLQKHYPLVPHITIEIFTWFLGLGPGFRVITVEQRSSQLVPMAVSVVALSSNSHTKYSSISTAVDSLGGVSVFLLLFARVNTILLFIFILCNSDPSVMLLWKMNMFLRTVSSVLKIIWTSINSIK